MYSEFRFQICHSDRLYAKVKKAVEKTLSGVVSLKAGLNEETFSESFKHCFPTLFLEFGVIV